MPSWVKLRPLSGSSSIFFSSMTVPIEALAVSTSGASPVTRTDSSIWPTVSRTSTRDVLSTDTRTPWRTAVRNPCSVAVTE